jgi:arylamine N-acetyltransferase
LAVRVPHDNLLPGSGGTCFESNYALFSLLLARGFTGQLTVNNMGETVGCQSAIVLEIDGTK